MSTINLSKDTQYKILDKVATIGVAVGTHSLFKEGWKALSGNNRPPENPNDPEVLWRDAFFWGAAVGLGVGLSKVLMKIVLDKSWHKYVGAKPHDE